MGRGAGDGMTNHRLRALDGNQSSSGREIRLQSKPFPFAHGAFGCFLTWI